MRVKSQKGWSVFTKVSALLLAVVLVVTGLQYFKEDNKAVGAASSSSTSNTTRVSVHDPSIFYDSSSGAYYIYGSHMAQAKSTDLRNWSTVGTQGYGNTSIYVSENVEGTYYIQNKFSGLYLDVENGSGDNGANIRQWDYNGADAQKFKFVSTGDGYYYILTGASGYSKCVDIDGGSSADGTNVMQWNYWGGACQKWVLEKAN